MTTPDALTFQPRDPGFDKTVRASFATQGFMTAIGAEMLALTPGHCVIGVAQGPNVTQQHGYFHGGLIGAIADVAGGYAAFSLIAAGDEILTVEFKVNFIAPAKGKRLEARGQVIRPGRTLTVAMVEVFAIDGEREVQCATMLQTLARIPAGS